MILLFETTTTHNNKMPAYDRWIVELLWGNIFIEMVFRYTNHQSRL